MTAGPQNTRTHHEVNHLKLSERAFHVQEQFPQEAKGTCVAYTTYVTQP